MIKDQATTDTQIPAQTVFNYNDHTPAKINTTAKEHGMVIDATSSTKLKPGVFYSLKVDIANKTVEVFGGAKSATLITIFKDARTVNNDLAEKARYKKGMGLLKKRSEALPKNFSLNPH
jgi:hypothetical protein